MILHALDDSVRDSMMQHTHTLEHRGQLISYQVIGEGEPILFIHSFLCHHEMWRPQLDRLSHERYQLIAIDLPGHGASGPSQPHSLEDLVEVALAVLDAQQIHQAIWAGLSIGGMISMRAALSAPDRVKALALFNTDAGSAPRGTSLQHTLLGYVLLTLRRWPTPILNTALQSMFSATAIEEQPELVSEWAASFRSLHLPSIRNTLRALNRRRSIVSRLSSIQCPTLVVHGEDDRALSCEQGREIAAQLTHAALHILPRVGHLSTLEAPGETSELLLDFLASLEAST